MSVLLASPVPLPDPPGAPAALEAVLDQLGSAGYAAGLTVHLLEPAAAVPGWQGADAAAAAGEVAAATVVAGELHAAVTGARSRLAEHHEVWLGVLARVAGLRDEQRAQFAHAASRLAVLVGPAIEHGGPIGAQPDAVALAEEVSAADAERAAEHRALLTALDEDAAATAQVLAAAVGPLGGTARPGAVADVTLSLATRLPGWGEAALTALGVQAADELTGRLTAAELDAAAARWAPWTSSPAFVDAVLGRLDAEGVTWLLTVLGTRAGPEEALTGFLAAAVVTAGTAGSRAQGVLEAVRLDPDDPDGSVDVVALGMGEVLGALALGGVGGAAAGGRAPGVAGLAAGWGKQLLAREVAQGAGAVARTTLTSDDPVTAALAVLAGAGDPGAAARLLDEPAVWSALLSRPWPPTAADLAAVVTLAAGAPTAPRVAEAGLGALGHGLAPGSPDRVLVGADVLQVVGGPLAALVAGQPDVLVRLLDAAATTPEGAELAPATDAALRGLAHLLTDPERETVVTAAVAAALAGGTVVSGGAVAGAYVAVQEHAQRLAYALAYSREHGLAVDREIVWTLAATLPAELLRGEAGDLAGEVLGLAAGYVGADGEVDLGPDAGAVHSADDAVRWVGQTLQPPPEAAGAVSAAVRAGFDDVLALLGQLEPPSTSFLDQVEDVPMPSRPTDRPGRK